MRVGTDIVAVPRVARLVADHGERFLRRWFSPGEIAYCTSRVRGTEHLAARLAAKEAVAKALRYPADAPVPWRSIEIVRSAAGAPEVLLHGAVAELARRGHVASVEVSLSRSAEYAVAVALVRSRGSADVADAGQPG